MPAYVVSQYRRSSEYDAYRDAVIELNHKYGARVLTQAGTEQCFEGEWAATAMVVIEFPTIERAKEFLTSREYKEVKALRKSAPPITIVAVEGAAKMPNVTR